MLQTKWLTVTVAVCFSCLAMNPAVPAEGNPALALNKSADLAVYWFVGQTITYNYTVSNTGDTAIFQPITIDDDIATDESCPATPPSLAPGQSILCTATHTVTLTDVEVGEVTNVATARGWDSSGAPVESPPDTLTVPVSTSDHTFGEPSWISDDPACPPGRLMTVRQHWLRSTHLEVELGICGYYEQALSAVSGEFTCVSVPGCGQSGEEGGPSLPFRRLILEIPFGSAPRLENTAVTTEVVQLGSPACPTQMADGDCGDATPPFTVHEELYIGDEFIPQDTVRITDVQIAHGKRLVHVEVYPVQYHPNNAVVAIASQMVFDVVMDELQPPTDPPRAIGEDYIIIVDDHISNVYTDCRSGEVNQIDRFADWKRQKGYLVDVVMTSDIDGFDMADPDASAQAIYDFIADRYHNFTPPPQYVLLIGDFFLIPSYLSSVENPGTHKVHWYLSDWRYTTVDPPAPDDDRAPDLFIGRLPIDTGLQCAAALEKILHYDMTPDTVGSWYENTLFAAFFQDPNDDCRADRLYLDVTQSIHNFFDSDTSRSTYTVLAEGTTCGENGYLPKSQVLPDGHAVTSPLRYNTDEHYFRWYENEAQASAIADVFNTDTVGLAVHRDHGSAPPVGWSLPEFHNHHVDALNNGWKTPVVLSINCATGKIAKSPPEVTAYEDLDCIAEAFIEKQQGGAVAVIAASAGTNGGYNESVLQGFIGGVWNDYSALNQINHNTRLGVLHAYMRDYLFQFHSTEFRALAHAEVYHIFGDPEMEFRIRRPRVVTAVDHASLIGTGITEYVVTAEATEGLNGALVALTQLDANGEVRLLGYGVMTDQDGMTVAVIELSAQPDPEAGPVTLTITHHSMTPYQAEISVNPENIDANGDGSRFAYGENVGWLNADSNAEWVGGMVVKTFGLAGWMWGENIGWISMSCVNLGSCGTVDYGVTNNGEGVLAGYAWGENVGWVSFSCENTASCGTASYGVAIDPITGDFSGRAWAENTGWITFASSGANPYKVTTSWCQGVEGPPELAPLRAPLLLADNKTDWSWAGVAGADWYEVTRGDLTTLRNSAGDFSVATDECAADNLTNTTFAFGSDPASSEGFWFLVRSANCRGKTTYDSGGTGQVGSRDGEIAGSAADCP